MRKLTAACLAAALAVPVFGAPKKPARKDYDYEKSKYKFKLEDEPKVYRFDQHGNPIRPGSSKKAAAKKSSGKKSAEYKKKLATEDAAPPVDMPQAPPESEAPELPQ